MPIIARSAARRKKLPSQFQRPSGWKGKLALWLMNWRHSGVTNWGLSHVSIREDDTVLDIGCGGGRTVAKLADLAPKGMVHGIDYASTSVAAALKVNIRLVALGRVKIQEASASDLPFAANTFDLVTAIETHFWWNDVNRGMREAFRVLKPGGRMAVIAEFYNGGKHARYADRLGQWTTMAILDLDQHRAMFADAGFTDVTVHEDPARGWICVTGTKPSSPDAGIVD